MANRYLTKSRYKLAKNCPTKLFYTQKKELYIDTSLDDPFLKALASGGFQVGELAKIHYPDGVMIDSLDYETAYNTTMDHLKKENIVIFEPAIKFKNLFIRVDILVKKGQKVRIIEVKSKSFDSTEENPFYSKRELKKGIKKISASLLPYLEDVAFQTFVSKKAFPEWDISPFLMLADKSKKSSIDGLNQRFLLMEDDRGRNKVIVKPGTNLKSIGSRILCEIDVSEETEIIQNSKNEENSLTYEDEIKYFSKHYQEDKKIPPTIGTHCKNCEFRYLEDHAKSGFHECWKEALGKKSINGPFTFDVWNFRKSSMLIDEGIYFLIDLKEEMIDVKPNNNPGFSSTERQWIQVESCKKNDLTPTYDQHGLKCEMTSWEFPLHFIDFETTMTAIPFNKGRRPYEQIAFQFSHHILDASGTIAHIGEYLNNERGLFPNFEFVRALKRELENDNGTIFRYAAHENTVLCQIYDQLINSEEPDKDLLCEWIKSVTTSKSKSRGLWQGERSMIDLCEIIKKFYYHPKTGGSNSIKKMLPAILDESKMIQKKYSKPIYGSKNGIKSLNFKKHTWIEMGENNEVIDPYKSLPRIFNNIETEKLDLLLGSDELADGGAAMMAYAKMQFSEMSDIEKNAVRKSLLKYCELDTFAMILIFEHFIEITGTSIEDLVA